MRRAFIGLSGPVGYCYNAAANKTINDTQSSPNPVLSGGLGLIVLFDEIWFACESLCPQNMRGLPYVRFLDQHYQVDLSGGTFDQEITSAQDILEVARCEHNSSSEGDQLSSLELDIAPYSEYACDNHSHGLKMFNRHFGGNADERNIAVDISLINRFKNLDLSVVLNNRTARCFTPALSEDVANVSHQALELAESTLRLNALPERANPEGPYHSIIEELRDDPLLRSFRKWMDGKTGRLDNKDVAMISAEIDQAIFNFRTRADRYLVKGKPIGARCYELFKDSVLKAVPGLSAAMKWQKGVYEEEEARAMRWQAFASISRQKIERH